jgi:hypothetical protein
MNPNTTLLIGWLCALSGVIFGGLFMSVGLWNRMMDIVTEARKYKEQVKYEYKVNTQSDYSGFYQYFSTMIVDGWVLDKIVINEIGKYITIYKKQIQNG